MFQLFKNKSKETAAFNKLKSCYLRTVSDLAREPMYDTLGILFISGGLANLRKNFIKNSFDISLEYGLSQNKILELNDKAYESTIKELSK
jgi:hypothetical protein